jgi:hypothetical protein
MSSEPLGFAIVVLGFVTLGDIKSEIGIELGSVVVLA